MMVFMGTYVAFHRNARWLLREMGMVAVFCSSWHKSSARGGSDSTKEFSLSYTCYSTTIPAAIHRFERACASFKAVSLVTSYFCISSSTRSSTVKSLPWMFFQRCAELSFMLIMLLKSIFALPSATIIYSPHMV